jgi:hypothetical protein
VLIFNCHAAMRRSALLITSAFCLAAAGSARAVVVAGGDGTQNTTAPGDDFGLANVGRVFNTANGFYNSGVYLGNGWVLSAYHVVRDLNSTGFLFGSVVFRDPVLGDTAFTVNPATAVRLQNADASFTDLALFRLTTTPTFLSAVSIASTLPSAGTAVTMAGNGLNRQAGLTYWDIDNSNVWTETTPPGEASGYKEINGSQSVRWGTNTIKVGPTTADTGFGNMTVFTTDFDNTANQAQASPGDSGGAVFYKNGATWELVGIMDATAGYPGQPDFTAVFGDETYAASLPAYRSQIVATVPEPGSLGLGLAGATVLGWRRRRRA